MIIFNVTQNMNKILFKSIESSILSIYLFTLYFLIKNPARLMKNHNEKLWKNIFSIFRNHDTLTFFQK